MLDTNVDELITSNIASIRREWYLAHLLWPTKFAPLAHQTSSTLGDELMPRRAGFLQIQFFASGVSHGAVAQNGFRWSLYSIKAQLWIFAGSTKTSCLKVEFSSRKYFVVFHFPRPLFHRKNVTECPLTDRQIIPYNILHTYKLLLFMVHLIEYIINGTYLHSHL